MENTHVLMETHLLREKNWFSTLALLRNFSGFL